MYIAKYASHKMHILQYKHKGRQSLIIVVKKKTTYARSDHNLENHFGRHFDS